MWKKRMLRPTTVVLILSLVLVVVTLYTAQHIRPFVSDDVSWQNILLTWHPFNGHQVDMGAQDNFVINVPLLALMGHFFAPSRTLLFVEAAIFAVINFFLFYVASLYFLKKCKIKPTYAALSPFLWLASFGYEFSQLFLNTAWRDFEPGVSFIYFMLAMKLYYGELGDFRSWRAKLGLLIASVIAGIFIYSDPYFLYFTVVPIAALFIFLFLAKKLPLRTLILVLGCVVLSLLVRRAAVSGLARMGLFIPASSANNIHLNELVRGTKYALNDIVVIFSASFSDLRVASLPMVAAILNLALLLAVGFRLLFRKFKRAGRAAASVTLRHYNLITAFFVAVCVIIFAANIVRVPDTYRYFVLFVYAFILIMTLILNTLEGKWRQVFVSVIAVATLANLATSLFVIVPAQAANAIPDKANIPSYEVIAGVERLGLTKGYVNYWDGNINSYLSDGKVEFLPVACSNGKTTKPLYLLDDTTLFGKPAKRTFYMINPDQTYPPGCSRQKLIDQFGKPQQIAHVLNKTLLIYNYDISSRMSGAF